MYPKYDMVREDSPVQRWNPNPALLNTQRSHRSLSGRPREKSSSREMAPQGPLSPPSCLQSQLFGPVLLPRKLRGRLIFGPHCAAPEMKSRGKSKSCALPSMDSKNMSTTRLSRMVSHIREKP